MNNDELSRIACETLSEDDPDSIPQFYLPLLRDHLDKYPSETNFIVEFAVPGKSNTSGNGFGVVTCMEDFCWQDITLDADPLRSDGGRRDGFGSFWNFQTHCEDPKHVKGRNERLSKAGLRIPEPRGALSQFQQASPSVRPSNTISGPSRSSAASSSHSAQSRSILAALKELSPPLVKPNPPQPTHSTPSRSQTIPIASSSRTPAPFASTSTRPASAKSVLRALSDFNLPDTKPDMRDVKPNVAGSSSFLKPIPSGSKENAIYILSDDDEEEDDDVIPLQPSQIPEDLRRAPTNRENPFELDSDDEEPVSRPSQPRSSQLASNPARSNPVFDDMQRQRQQRADRAARQKHLEDLQREVNAKREAGVVSTQIPVTQSQSGLIRPQNTPQALLRKMPLSPTMANTIRSDRMQFLRYEAAILQGLYNRATSTTRPPTAVKPLPADVTARIAQVNVWINVKGEQEWTLPNSALMQSDAAYAKQVTTRKIKEDKWEGMFGKAALFPDQNTVANAQTPSFQELYNAIAGPSNFYNPNINPNNVKPESNPSLAGTMPDYPGMGYPGMPGAFPLPGAPLDPLDPNVEDFGYEYDRPRDMKALQEFFTKGLDDFHDDEDVEEARKKLDLTNGDDTLPGMNISLMAHQILGVAFMLSKERDAKHKGGLMCDAMGLGKTVQTIGIMVANPPKGRVKTNLIVAPLALLTQWKGEIENKAPDMFKVLIYHGPNRVKSTNMLKIYDVVLTTYGTLTAEFGTEDKPDKKKKRKKRANSFVSEDDEEEPEIVVRKKGPLFKVNWYRVVLDEAHIVRNRNTRAAKAVIDLEGAYKWALTGTLIVNGLDDVYTQLRFVGTSPLADWKEFRTRISGLQKRKPKLATKRLQVVLKQCMIRRHKDSELNGKRLLELPPKETIVDELDFTMEERQIYRAVEERAKVRFCKYLKAGTVLKHYSVVLVLLLRLRQLTCHPYLLRRNPNEESHPGDLLVDDDELQADITAPRTDDIGEVARAVTMLGQEWVTKIRKQLTDRQHLLIKAEKNGDEEAAELESCSICMDGMENEMVTVCQHTFCFGCLDEIFKAPARDNDLTDEQTQKGCRKCPLCRTVINRGEMFRASAFEEKLENEEEAEEDMAEEEEEIEEIGAHVKKEKKRSASGSPEDKQAKKMRKLKGKGKARADEIDELDSDDDEDVNDIEAVLPSTKMRHMGDLVMQYLDEAPTTKIIIFSQFVQYIELCSIFLRRKGVQHVTYVGAMKQNEREEAVKEFSNSKITEDSPRVMIISLKCGGVGLNLTAASRVICLDLAWNAATENQAVDRAHRIGQTKPVEVRRLIVRDTVEQRILALQESKEAMANGAMGEGGAGKIGRLSVRDLIKLFGVDEDPE